MQVIDEDQESSSTPGNIPEEVGEDKQSGAEEPTLDKDDDPNGSQLDSD
jgi:hypothetical protein